MAVKTVSGNKMTPLFEQLASSTLEDCMNTFRERGEQYGDTWRECQWLVLRSVLRELLGNSPTSEKIQAIALAALVDIKHQRFQGGFGSDHLIDGINYQAALASVMRRIELKDSVIAEGLAYKPDDLDNIQEV